MKLNQKVVIVTGANGGLGNTVTKAFLDAGARVTGVSRAIKDADFYHANFSAMPATLATHADAQQLVEQVLHRFERVDALVHLVGGFAGGSSIADTDESTLDKMMEMNVRSALLAIRAVLPAMRAQKSGRILAIGSKAAVEPTPMAGVYAASKAALVSLIRTLAQENAGHGISANIVLPGTMDTPANRAAMPAADFSRWVQPSQVAALLVHLISDEASQINGAVIPVFGGEA